MSGLDLDGMDLPAHAAFICGSSAVAVLLAWHLWGWKIALMVACGEIVLGIAVRMVKHSC